MTNTEKLNNFLKNRKKQLVGVALPQKTYENLKKQSMINEETLQQTIRKKLSEASNDEVTNEFLLKKINLLIKRSKSEK